MAPLRSSCTILCSMVAVIQGSFYKDVVIPATSPLSGLHAPSTGPIIDTKAMLNSVHGRRLAGHVSAACTAICPNAMSDIDAFGAAAGEAGSDMEKLVDAACTGTLMESTACVMKNKEGDCSAEAAMFQGVTAMECLCACPGLSALSGIEKMTPAEQTDAICKGNLMGCVNENAAGKCAQSAKDLESFGCMCACPDFAAFAQAKTDKDRAAIACSGKSAKASMGCIQTESTCAAMAKEISPSAMNLFCARTAAGCSEKGDKLGTCMGDDMAKWAGECKEGHIPAGKTGTCCPILKKMVGCYSKDCLSIDMAGNHVEGKNAEDTQKKAKEVEKMDKMRTDCPNAGMPTKAEVIAAKDSAETPIGASASDDAAQHSALIAIAAAMVSMILA